MLNYKQLNYFQQLPSKFLKVYLEFRHLVSHVFRQIIINPLLTYIHTTLIRWVTGSHQGNNTRLYTEPVVSSYTARLYQGSESWPWFEHPDPKTALQTSPSPSTPR